ncbi:MAG: hypothetical protein FJ276_13965, partial [Planctomycetes bacterium]|nr:hypothetical protein [Planctomycetota bacterium]
MSNARRQRKHGRPRAGARRAFFEQLECRQLLAADASLRFAFADSVGAPLASLHVGDEFTLQAYIRDTRVTPAPKGFLQAHFDVLYGASLLSATGAVIPGPEYASFPSGSTSTDGLIDEAGGLDTDVLSPDPTTAELLLFSAPFRADTAGTLVLSVAAAGKTTLRFDEPVTVPVTQFAVTGNTIDILAPEIRVTPTSGLQTTEAGGTATFVISLFTAPTADVTIALASSDTTEGTVSPASVTFTPANWTTPKTVTITGADDFQADGNIAYQIITQPAVSADPRYHGVNPQDVSVTNLDNDFIGITVEPTSGQTTEAGGTSTFQIFLNSQPTANVTISLSSSDTTEGTVSPTGVTFTPANWNIPQTVTVTGQDDFIADGNQTYSIITSAAVSGDANYNNRPVADVSMTNIDNDVVGITVQPITGQTTEAGGTDTFQIVLTSEPSANVTINLSSSNTAEGTVVPTSV